MVSRFGGNKVLRHQLGWSTSSYVAIQAIRFISNLMLTRILAPWLFGVMTILTSIRVGLELLSDVGIGQNIIANKNAYDPKFYNTAWTIQIFRGVALAFAMIALSPALTTIYPEKSLHQVLPLFSVLFILTGIHSVGVSLAIKSLKLASVAKYEVYTTLAGVILTIGVVYLFPTIWGLVAGNLLAALSTTIGSYFVFTNTKHRLMIDRRYASEIIRFGRWVFISSIVFFLATNYDRLMLGKYVSLELLGVYGIARSLSDIFAQFASRVGNLIIFPSISLTDLRGPKLRAKIQNRRLQFLFAVFIAMAPFIALSDYIIAILYDPRYAAAARVLPWVGLAAWFGILSTLNDSVLLGLSKPLYTAAGNVSKFAFLLALLPIGILHFGIVGAAAATTVAEFSRYCVLLVGQAREDVRFFRQDLLATIALIILAVFIRWLAAVIGLVAPMSTLISTQLR